MRYFLQHSLAIVAALWLIQSPNLFAQTECELLLTPPRPGYDSRLDVIDLNRVLNSLSPRFVPEMALLTPEQLDQIKAIRAMYSAPAENLPAELADSPEEVNRVDRHQRMVAPKMLADLEQVLGELWPLVVFDANRRLAAGYGDPSGLSLSTVVNGLKLQGKQITQIEKLKNEIETEQKKLKSGLTVELTSLLDEHFAAVKKELDSVQQARFLTWFGDLNLFKSLALSDQYRNLVQQSQHGGDLVMEPTRFQNNDKPAIVRKDFEMDSLLYQVLTMDGIKEILTLAPEQVEQIANQIHGNDIRLILKNRRTERMLNILAGKWELPEWLDKILLPHQKTWMQQFEFQVYNMPYADSFGLLNPDVAESLKLSENTKKRILKLAQDYRTKVADLSRTADSASALAEKDKQIKMLKMLTPEQMHQYRLWFGQIIIDP